MFLIDVSLGAIALDICSQEIPTYKMYNSINVFSIKLQILLICSRTALVWHQFYLINDVDLHIQMIKLYFQII